MHRYCKQKISKKAPKKDNSQKCSLLHESIDRILNEYGKDSIHYRENGQRGRVSKQKNMISLHDLNIVQSERTAHQTNIHPIHQTNIRPINIRDNNTKFDDMEENTEKRKIAERNGASECVIGDVSSITENEYNSIQQDRNPFPTADSSFLLQDQAAIVNKQTEPNIKDKALVRSTCIPWVAPNASPMQSQSISMIRNCKSTTPRLEETNIPNLHKGSLIGFQKEFRPNEEEKKQAMIALGAHHQQNFPHLNRNAILFDQNGNSVDRFIVRSDGIICPVKQVSAFSVHSKQHANTFRRNENERPSLNAETCFDYGPQGAELLNRTRKANGEQRSTRRLERENGHLMNKNPPLQLSKLALQARAFRKFQYMLAVRFRRYFLREYLRNRRFQKSLHNNKPEAPNSYRRPTTDERFIHTSSMNRDLSTQSNIDFSKHSLSDIVDGLNLYTTSCSNERGDISGLQSSQLTSSSLLQLFEETPASSLRDNGFDLLQDDLVDTLIDDNLCRANGHTNGDTATRRNNISFDISAPHPIHPSQSAGSPFHVRAQVSQNNSQRFPLDRNSSNEALQTPFEDETFQGRKEILAPQNNFDIYSSFQKGDQYDQFIRKYSNSFSASQNYNFDVLNSDTGKTSVDEGRTATITPYRKPSATFSNVHKRVTEGANYCRAEPTDLNIRTSVSRNAMQENEITNALLLSQDLQQPDFFNF